MCESCVNITVVMFTVMLLTVMLHNSVLHTARVEPPFEQSMQYNEMYIPTDPTQSELHVGIIADNLEE